MASYIAILGRYDSVQGFSPRNIPYYFQLTIHDDDTIIGTVMELTFFRREEPIKPPTFPISGRVNRLEDGVSLEFDNLPEIPVMEDASSLTKIGEFLVPTIPDDKGLAGNYGRNTTWLSLYNGT